MPREVLHRFEYDGKRFAIDPETCFCFECDAISWDLLDHYPHETSNRIYHLLGERHDPKELSEVIGELEWLRATSSILPPPKQEEMLKVYEVERGLKRLSLAIQEGATARARKRWFGAGEAPPEAGEARHLAHGAIALLFARSGKQTELELELVAAGRLSRPEAAAQLAVHAFRSATLAGKKLTVLVRVDAIAPSKCPAVLDGHTVSAQLVLTSADDAATHIGTFARAIEGSLPRLSKMFATDAEGVSGRIIVRPGHPRFGGVVEALDGAGFGTIELDVDGAYVADSDLDPAVLVAALSESAVYYAQRLLKHQYFRLDPIAPLFWRIYNGKPVRRTDPIGTNELAVDGDGGVYPCRSLIGVEGFRLGSVRDAALDEGALSRYEDVGSLTTPACIHCWARNLCGGGTAAVHHALSGSHRTPHEPWCDGQRAWLESVVSAFQLLSSAAVNFERIHNSLGGKGKTSLFTLARAALRMTIAVRPVEESDAPMLAQWENWNESAYFLFNGGGVLLATTYDREMDALHPRGIEQELMLTRRNGEPLGLFKIRPEPLPGVAQGWIYMHAEANYASESVRKGFRAIIEEAGAQQAVTRLTVSAAPHETGLRAFLEGVGFDHAGDMREALYLHGAYHDVAVYRLAL